MAFNYPIRVIRKKLNSDNYKPFAIDCSTGSNIPLETNKKSDLSYLLLQILLFILSVGMLYFVLIQPLIQTFLLKDSVAQSLESLGKTEYDIIRELTSNGSIISESVDQGVITLVVPIEHKNLDESLRLALSLNSIREVYTDGKTISVEFISSEK